MVVRKKLYGDHVRKGNLLFHFAFAYFVYRQLIKFEVHVEYRSDRVSSHPEMIFLHRDSTTHEENDIN